MPWPNTDITVLDDTTAGAFSTSIQANFSPPEAGRLLLAFYSNDPEAGGGEAPDEAGWTEQAFFGSAPSYVWTKVSDGTETTLTVNHGVADRQTTLVVVSIRADLSTLEGPSDHEGPTTDTMVVASGPVNTRFDFTIGDDAPAPFPSSSAPAVLISGHNGAAFRRANSFYAIPLDSQATGASVAGLLYNDMSNVGNGATSFLLNIRRPWAVGHVRSFA